MPCMFTSFINDLIVKGPANQLPPFFDAAMYRCIAVLYILSGFQGDGFLGIFFPILLCILYFSLAEWLAT